MTVLIVLLVAAVTVAVHAIVGWVRASQTATQQRYFVDAFHVEKGRRENAELLLEQARRERDAHARHVESLKARLTDTLETYDLVGTVREQAERLHGEPPVPEGMNG